MTEFEQEYRQYCEAHGQPERIELILSDLNAVLRGKWLPAQEIDKLYKNQVRLPLSTYAPNIFGFEIPQTGLGIVAGDPDGILKPIKNTLKPTPWAKGHAAQVLVEMHELSGGISDLSPRNILQRMLKKFNDKGLYPVVACELEFYILNQRKAPIDPPTPPTNTYDAQNYDLEILSRNDTLLRDIQTIAHTQGLPINTMIAEFGPGQFEINFHHTDDVLSAADTAILFRRLVRNIAVSHGIEATFMAKPYKNHPGNGMHLHVSILDENGKNIFATSQKEPNNYLRYAVGGTLDSMRDFQAIFAPHQNSYRRYFKGSFAPCAPDWAIDDRNAGVRLPEIHGASARLEHRVCGADTNPYLAISAILYGILHGLEQKIDPPLPLTHEKATSPQSLTTNWAEAVDYFTNSTHASTLLGQKYHHIYTTLRRNEITQLEAEIPPIEYKTYLTRL